ncbi:Calx-beta domain-containing protein, partial [Spirosoma oryzae]
MKHYLPSRWLAILSCLCLLFAGPNGWAQRFSPGNLVIYRVGTGTGALSGSATPVFLDEYTPAGALVRSVALPTTASGSNRALTATGTATSEGLLSRSSDGKYLLLTGYDAAIGTASISNTTSANVNRVVARVAADGTIDASTALTDFSSGNNPRSAISTDGTSIWVTGGSGGIRYTTLGATTSTQLSTTTINLRQANIANGQLYVSSSSGSTRVATVGSGTPTTSGQTISNIPGFPSTGSPYAFFFADVDASVPGVDVLYLVDDTGTAGVGGIVKYSLVNNVWTSNGTVGAATDIYRGLTGSLTGTAVTLYAIRKAGELVTLTDNAGYNGAISGTPTLLVTATANTAFRGVAFAPASACPTIAASLGGNNTICEGTSTNLTATITGGTGPYSLTYSNGATNTVVSNYTSGSNIAVSPTANTTYTLVKGTDANGCAATVSGSAQVTVSQNPTTANAGSAQTIFTGQSATLAANAPTTGTGMWSVTSGPSTVASQFSDVSSPTATFTPAGGVGNYVLTWTISNSPCTPSTSTVTITKANPTVNLSVSSNTVSEAAQTAITVTATAAAPVVGNQTVNLAVTGTGITSGDYTLSNNTITILNGQTSGSVTFTVVDDNAVEGTETATLTISNPSSGIALGSTVAQTISITDNDVAPGLSINDVSANEGNSGTTTFTFTVSLATPAPAGGVSFNYATADGTAKAGTDYVATSGTGTIPEGSSTITISVLVNGNTTFEADKTFYVNVSNVTGASVSKGQGTGTILNDDVQPLPDLTVALSGPASATTGQAYSYSLVVSNSGTANASNVSVAFTLPNGVTYASATGSGTFAVTQIGATVSFTGGTLTQGSNATLIVGVTAGTAGTVSVSPGAAVADPNSTITESNENNNSSTQTVTTTVVAPNRPPVVPTLPNQSGTVAVAFTYTVPAFTDPENGVLTYTITGLPTGLTIDNSTRVISGTPTVTGTSTVTAVATDPQSATAEGTFTITVNANQAPVAPTFSNQTATVGTAFSYVVPAFTDAENQALIYVASGVPSPLTFDPATRTLSGTPTVAGTSTITITATDPAINATSGSFNLTVNSAPAAGVIRITEYMYASNNGAGNGVGEFFELTNVGNAPIDLTGWSFDDNTRLPGSFAIGGLGTVQPNESVIVTDATDTQFRAFWYLPNSVKVIGGSNQGLGRSDEINIYDASNTLVTRLTYNDQGTSPAGTVRTQFVSAWPQRNLLGQANTAGWQLSVANDAQNTYLATTGDLGNPGGYFIALPRVKVVESNGTTIVTEGGATDTYTVALNSQPSADVTVSISAGSQLSVSASTLTFTPANYNTAQTVTVTAVDDNVYQGAPRFATITQTVTSSDATYNGLVASPVSVTIIDNDSPVTSPPTIQAAVSTTAYLSLPVSGQGYVSGVINDPTDPAKTQGINFTLADTDTDVNLLTVTASSNNGNATVSLTGSGNSRNLTITPVSVGYSTITLTVSDGVNTANYIVNYAASAASVAPATTRFHTGTSDASTAIMVDANYMLVGDDENQVLRLYNRQNSGLPVAGFDFTSSLGLTDLSGGVPREVDLELSVRQNNRIFWIGSESNADAGSSRPNRNRVYATDLSGSGASTTLSYVGRYDHLRDDIINWDVNNGHGKGANYYGLQASAAAGVGSKQTSGYNIEGAEFAPDGNTVYLGFRAPQVLPANRTKALIVPVTNLTSLISGQAQGAATFGAPIELDLGGRGIREMRRNSSNQYVIIAGPAGDAGASPNDFRLFSWTGNAGDVPVERNANLTALAVNGSFESIVEVPASLDNNTTLQLLVDNGDAVYYNDGTVAKDLGQNNFKKFRSELVSLGSPLNTAPVATVNTNQTATVGTAFTYTVNAFTDTETPTGLTYAAVIDPANGLSFDPATRIISGTPTASGVSSVTVTATDPGSLSATTTFTITASPTPVTALTVTATANPTQLLTSGSTTITASVSGGKAPYNYSFTGPGTITANGNTATVAGLPAGEQTLTVTVTDATTPTAQTSFTTVSLTVTHAGNPTVPFSITSVSLTGCEQVTASERRVTLLPNYAGLTGETIRFRVANEIDATTSAGPYTLRLYTDNPVISLRAIQGSGAEVSYSYNWLAACTSTSPANTAPVAVANADQSATVGSAFSYTVKA